ncbi:galanin receptor 2a-like [Antedon mediterranea]|uniref:galanin receptor 2a-like n=1 Tax=Antedon mediterranea TaxID=105859 RepID=UPI003AF7FB5B
MVDEIFIAIFMPIVVIFGIIGNILTITVIVRHQRMRTSVNVYLANMAIADAIFLAMAPDLVWTSLTNSPIRDTYDIGIQNPWVCKFNFYVVDATYEVAIFTIVAMSIERYRAIYHPISFHNNKSVSILRAIQICCFIWFITLAWQSRKLFWVEMVEYQFPWPDMYNGLPNLTTACVFCLDDFDCKLDKYLYMFDTCLSLTLMLVVVGLYTAILIKLRTSTFSAAGKTARSKSEKKVFLTVFLAATAYIVCTAPFDVLNIILTYGDVDYNTSLKAFNILRVALYMNSSVNPIIYNAVNDEFRKAFLKIFYCNYRKPKAACANSDREVGLTTVSLVSYSTTNITIN